MLKLLLPALIPSWRFFDVIAPSPRIEYAPMNVATEPACQWQEFRPRPAHRSLATMLKCMVWNPKWNESLFMVSCAERLMAAPSEHSIHEIARRIANEFGANPPPYFQFRLVFVSRSFAQLRRDVTYVSPVLDTHESRDA